MKRTPDSIKNDIIVTALENMDDLLSDIQLNAVDERNYLVADKIFVCSDKYFKKCSEAIFETYNHPDTYDIYKEIQEQKECFKKAFKSISFKPKELTLPDIYSILHQALFKSDAEEEVLMNLHNFQGTAIVAALIEMGNLKDSTEEELPPKEPVVN